MPVLLKPYDEHSNPPSVPVAIMAESPSHSGELGLRTVAHLLGFQGFLFNLLLTT